MLQELQDFFISNIAYDVVKQLIYSIMIAMGFNILLGPMFNKISGHKQHIGLFLIISIMVFLTAAFIQPQPRPILKVDGLTIYTIDRPVDGLMDPAPGTVQAILVVPIINSGTMPSIARNFGLIIKFQNKDYEGMRYVIPDEFIVEVKGARVSYFGEDSLVDKALTPIGPGGYVAGLLYFSFPRLPIDSIRSLPVEYTLSFEDVLGNKTTKTIEKTLISDDLRRYPGITQKLHPR